MDMEEEKYIKFLFKLDKYIPNGSQNHKRFMKVCAGLLDLAAMETDEFLDICQELYRKEIFKTDDLEILKQVFVFDVRAYSLIIEREKEINLELSSKSDPKHKGIFSYHDLLLRLESKAPKESNNYKRLMQAAAKYLSPNELSGSVLDVFDHLHKKGLLEPMNLAILKNSFNEDAEALQDIKNTKWILRVHQMIISVIKSPSEVLRSEGQKKYNNRNTKRIDADLLSRHARGGASHHYGPRRFPRMHARGMRHRPDAHLLSRQPRGGLPHRYVQDDIKDEEDQENKLYEKRPDQKGYMVILTWTHDPHESDVDMTIVSKFFMVALNWDVDMRTNLTETELMKYISDLQSRFNEEDFAGKYYCFGVAVIGHGSEGKIEVADGNFYEIEKLINAFKNDKIPTFVGKPRFFLIEACRGPAEQPTVLTRQPSQATEVKMSLPVDSDIHISYATTKGYVSHFSKDGGSWFTIAAMDEFTSNYKQHHMEDMLINVRLKVAAERDRDKGQMPCSWSTFTKRLYLASAGVKI